MKLAALAFAAVLLAQPVQAQAMRYDVKTINFDLWCQEQAKLPPDRCDKRLPADDKEFEAYRAKIEKYEIPYLKRKEQEQDFDRTVLHNDPIDNPIDKDPAAQSQTSTPAGNGPNP